VQDSKSGRRFPIGPLAWLILTPLITVPATLIGTSILTPFDNGARYATLEDVQAAADADHLCKVTVGAADIFGGVDASAACPDGYIVAALSPGLINLAPLLWLLFGRVSVRRTAVVASVFGAARLLIPMIAVATAVPTEHADTITRGHTLITPGFPWAFPNSWNDAPLFSFLLWIATVAAYFVQRYLARRRRRRLAEAYPAQ